MHVNDYVEAAYEVLSGSDKPAHVLTELKRHLKERGLEKMYPRILRGLQSKIERKNKSVVPKVVVARKKDLERYKKEINAALKRFETDIEPEIQIDEHIIGGFVATGKNERIDHSFKSKLLHAYHRVTH